MFFKNFKIISLFFLLFIYSSVVFGFQDKKGREINIEWDLVFTENDKAITHKSYDSQKEHYQKLGIDYQNFFTEYNLEVEKELKTQENLSLENEMRKYYLLRAKHGETVCGYAYYKKEETYFYLELLALHSDYQKSGIGKHLVFGLHQRFPNTKIELVTRTFNLNSQVFYEHIGFSKQPEKKEHYVRYVWEK